MCRYFPFLRACLLGFSQKWQEGLECITKALALRPDDPELLYLEAAARKQLGGSRKMHLQAIDSHLRFLKSAPPDHRKVPESKALTSFFLIRI
jgi:hypothetical protein